MSIKTSAAPQTPSVDTLALPFWKPGLDTGVRCVRCGHLLGQPTIELAGAVRVEPGNRFGDDGAEQVNSNTTGLTARRDQPEVDLGESERHHPEPDVWRGTHTDTPYTDYIHRRLRAGVVYLTRSRCQEAT